MRFLEIPQIDRRGHLGRGAARGCQAALLTKAAVAAFVSKAPAARWIASLRSR